MGNTNSTRRQLQGIPASIRSTPNAPINAAPIATNRNADPPMFINIASFERDRSSLRDALTAARDATHANEKTRPASRAFRIWQKQFVLHQPFAPSMSRTLFGRHCCPCRYRTPHLAVEVARPLQMNPHSKQTNRPPFFRHADQTP